MMRPMKSLLLLVYTVILLGVTCSPTVWSQKIRDSECAVPEYMSIGAPVYAHSQWTPEGVQLCGNSMTQWSENTCCTLSTINTLMDAYNTLKTSRENELLNFENTISTVAQDIIQHYVRMEYDEIEALRNVLGDYFEDIQYILGRMAFEFPETTRPCLSSLLKYLTGGICIGCDEKWADYIEAHGDGESSHYTFKLSTGTCDMIHNRCLDLMNMTVLYNRIAANIVDHVENPVSHCDPDTNCDEYMCNHLVSGGSIHFNAIFSQPTQPTPLAKRSFVSPVAKLAAAYKEGMPKNSKEYFMKQFMVLADTFKNAFTNANDKGDSLVKRDETPSNTYDESGFQAHIVGIETEMETYEEKEPEAPESVPEEEDVPEGEDVPESEDVPEEEDVPEGEDSPEEEDVPEGEDSPEEEDVPEGEDSPEEEDAPEGEDVPEEEDTPDGEDAPETDETPVEEEAPEFEYDSVPTDIESTGSGSGAVFPEFSVMGISLIVVMFSMLLLA